MPFTRRVFAVVVLALFPAVTSLGDIPTTLVNGGVTDFDLEPPKLFWHTLAYCPPDPPKAPVGPGGGDEEPAALGGGGNADDPELIRRVPSYADWYAGHEIGHTLGRGHPIKEADDPDTNATEGCGHDSGDPNYPYNGAFIGPSGGSLQGFDMGNAAIKPAVLPRDTWTDMMSYCDFQWISDYTYMGMYNFLIGSGGGAQADLAGAGGGVSDWLSVFGIIAPDPGIATLHHCRRLGSVGRVPGLRPGPYSIRLLDGQGGQLADYPFTPATPEDGSANALSFGQVVPFVAGSRQLKIVKVLDGQVLAMKAISASPPLISNVHLEGAPSPVAGVVTLAWTASDPDGDTLCFDILYSSDAGASFDPVFLNRKGSSAPVNTSGLAGGTGIFRVIATDGCHSAFADSPPYTMALKNPDARILLPAGGTQVHWGALVNFAGQADDPQDGSVAPGGLQWTTGRRVLGTGPFISVDDLRVGVNVISLRAVNSAGQSDSASVTVIVDDDLSLPGPTLTAGPPQIGWHVAAGSPAVVTAQIGISNAGSGTLNWTAAENAPWLSLSAASGTAPDLVTVSANPTGLPDATIATADVVIDGPGGQSVTIPVTLWVGDVYTQFGNEPPSSGGFRRSDSNNDGQVNISDPVNTLTYLFSGGGIVRCPDAADANDDGQLNISDPVFTLGFLFQGTALPPAPGKDACGSDPTADPLLSCVYDPGDC